jgi:hypothetical protein
MGRLARLLSFLNTTRNGAKVSDAKVNPGGGPNITAQHFSDPGDDSQPLPGDYVSLNGDSGSGRETAIGYVDPINTPKAQKGDKRIYARGPDGVAVVDVWLKNTGEAVTSNSNGSFTLSPAGAITGTNGGGSFALLADGTFNVNGVTIDPSGVVTIPNSLILNSKQIAEHDHSNGNNGQDTGVNN